MSEAGLAPTAAIEFVGRLMEWPLEQELQSWRHLAEDLL